MKRQFLLTAIGVLATTVTVHAQQKKVSVTASVVSSSMTIPISNANLGTFPYFKTLPNFYPTDSLTNELNRAYFYDGKAYFSVDGQVSTQNLNVKDDTKKIPSEFQLIQEFDKMVSTLGGKKVYEGKLPEDQLKKFTDKNFIELGSRHQLAPSAFYGVVEYVIKTPEKEVWLQLVPEPIASKFYTLLVVEKKTPLITTNTNRDNVVLRDLEKGAKSIINLEFEPDNSTLLTQSKDELLSIVGVLQAHPDWKMKIDINNAPIGTPDYVLALTEKRATAIKEELVGLGVKPSSVEIKGVGDTKPLVANDTEQGRVTNTRVEISKF